MFSGYELLMAVYTYHWLGEERVVLSAATVDSLTNLYGVPVLSKTVRPVFDVHTTRSSFPVIHIDSLASKVNNLSDIGLLKSAISLT